MAIFFCSGRRSCVQSVFNIMIREAIEGTWCEADRKRRTTDLHGEGGVSLFEEDVPHVECTLHACCEEHTWTSGAPAAISQVRCTIPVSVCVCVSVSECVCVSVSVCV